MLTSTQGPGMPTRVRAAIRRSGLQSADFFFMRFTVPRGESSVMPQAWRKSMPYSSRKVRIMAGGAEEPPTTMVFSSPRPPP